MNEQEARLILQACPPGAADRSDPQVVEALQMAERSPELARWLAEEQAFDCAVSAQLAALPAPFGLKTRILAQNAPPASSRVARWIFSLAGAAALLFLLVQIVDFWRGAAPATASLSGYAGEMVSFVKLPPPLEMESNDLGSIKDWLAKNNRLTPEVPTGLAALPSAGCRVLSYRGHKVTLVCFHRENGGLAHLFAVDRSALPGVKAGDAPSFVREGEWTTAIWAEGDRAYMIAVQGDEAAVRGYLPDA
ncbi:MAG: hypothetical protein H0W66_09325 [Chthoniobacterales bacterium]|nr:hypothetical protein [Chthoniobacterales bacterium]